MKYIRFVKIEHTFFSLPVVFAGTFLALGGRALAFREFFWIVMAVMAARAAGFGFNRILDSKIDAQNPRTRNREIPSGGISVPEAWIFTWVFGFLFVFSSFQLSKLCFVLSFIPLILFLAYPFLKRITMWC